MSTFGAIQPHQVSGGIHPSSACASGAWGFWTTLAWAVAAFAISTLMVEYGVAPAIDALQARHPELPSYVKLFVPNFALLLIFPGLLVFIVRLAGSPVMDYLGLVRPHWRHVLLVPLCLAVFFLGEKLLDLLIPAWTGPVHASDMIRYRRNHAAGFLTMASFVFGAILVAPVLEELLFRGFLFRGWSQSLIGVAGTILLTALVFGLGHQQYPWPVIAFQIAKGVIYGWVRWVSGSTSLTIILHVMNNLESHLETMITANASL